MELKRYWEILYRNRRALVLVVIIVVLSAFLVSWLATPVYRVTASVVINTNPMSGLLSGIQREYGYLNYFNKDFVVGTIESFIKSDPIIKNVIRNLNLRNKRGELFEARKFVNQNFLKIIFLTKKGAKVKNISDSNVFEIHGYSTDPDESQKIANGIVEEFLQTAYSTNQSKARADQEAIEANINNVLKKLRAAEEDEKQFKIRENIINLSEQTTTAINQLSDLETAQALAKRSLEESSSIHESIKTTLRNHSEFYKAEELLADDTSLVNYKEQLLTLEMKLASYLTSLKAEHPDVREIKEQIKVVKKNIKREILRKFDAETTGYYSPLLEKYVNSEIDNVTYTIRLKMLSKQISDKKAELSDMPEKDLELTRLNTKVKVLRNRYTALLEDLEIVKLAQILKLANIEVVQKASISDVIDNNLYFPKKKEVALILSLTIGLLMGICWVFLYHFMDDTLKTEEEVRDILGQSVLGIIPRVPGRFMNINKFDSNPPLVNSMLNLKSKLRLISSGKDYKVLSMVSCQKGDGKSILATLLAYVFARAGQKVLLVDANLNRPKIHDILHLPPGNFEKGLNHYLQDESSVENMISKTSHENLDVILSGSKGSKPLRIIDPSKMAHLIGSLKPKYDRIIIDSLSIQESTNTVEISTEADGVMFVVVSQKTSPKSGRGAIDLLKEAKCEVIGVVLNKVRREYL